MHVKVKSASVAVHVIGDALERLKVVMLVVVVVAPDTRISLGLAPIVLAVQVHPPVADTAKVIVTAPAEL